MRVKSWTIHRQFVPSDYGQVRWDQIYQLLVLPTQITLPGVKVQKEEVAKDENCFVRSSFDPTPGAKPNY